ncbi:hypothetical protein DFP74_3262 [Nocardiopsis sp. Huas11]|nr:hypothetical protein DFP74_3262 [Nocardiopsis sp. Huas11]
MGCQKEAYRSMDDDDDDDEQYEEGEEHYYDDDGAFGVGLPAPRP